MATKPVERAARGAAARKKKKSVEEEFRLGRRNLQVLAAGVGAIVIGYILLALNSLTMAPVLLVIGYCVLVPLSLFWRPRATGGEPPTPRPREGDARS